MLIKKIKNKKIKKKPRTSLSTSEEHKIETPPTTILGKEGELVVVEEGKAGSRHEWNLCYIKNVKERIRWVAKPSPS